MSCPTPSVESTPARPGKGGPVSFDEVCRALDFSDFDRSVARLIRRLDRTHRRVECRFPRKTASRAGHQGYSQSWYRQAVNQVPVMGREQERAFCMGVEFLWRRLQKVRRAAGFSGRDLERQPGLADQPCDQCGPGRLRICFGCAPANMPEEIRVRLRERTREFVLARNELIERNLYIVFRLLERYRGVGVPVDDLIQEANTSLFKAVEGFDVFRGVRFKTYATYWVNQAFLNAIYNQSRTVRVPAYIQKAMKKINDATGSVAAGAADREAIAVESGVPVDLVRTAITGNRFTLSLDRPLDDESGSRMLDLMEDRGAGLDFAAMGESRLGKHLSEALRLLSPREQRILQMRYGLDGERIHTLSEVGAELGISLERVRQVQKAALAKIREGHNHRLLEQYA